MTNKYDISIIGGKKDIYSVAPISTISNGVPVLN